MTDDGEHTEQLEAVEQLEEPVDLLLVTVKAYGLGDGISHIRTEPGLVLPLLNGLEHMDVLRARFARVVAAAIGHFEGYRESPTRIVQQTPGVVNVAATRLRSSWNGPVSPRGLGGSEKDVLWEKLARQGPIAVLTSVAGETIGELRTDRRLRLAIEEACAVAVADGARTTFDEQWASSSPCRTGPHRPPRATSPPGVLRARRDRRRGGPRGPPPRRSHLPSKRPSHNAQRDRPHRRALGLERVPNKNIRPLAGHPLLAYAIATAQQSGVFERVVVSTDSEAIADVARWYGAEVPFLRPASTRPRPRRTSSGSPTRSSGCPEQCDLFAIVRATNPFRGPDVVRRGLEQLLARPRRTPSAPSSS